WMSVQVEVDGIGSVGLDFAGQLRAVRVTILFGQERGGRVEGLAGDLHAGRGQGSYRDTVPTGRRAQDFLGVKMVAAVLVDFPKRQWTRFAARAVRGKYDGAARQQGPFEGDFARDRRQGGNSAVAAP